MEYREKTSADIIMSGTTLQEFEYKHEVGMQMKPWLERLRAEPDIAVRLLETENANIIYMGRESDETLGMRFASKTDFSRLKGENRYGKFLMALRDEFRRELSVSGSAVEPVRTDDVVVDFTVGGQRGGQESFVTGLERDGERFIHTDPLPYINPKRKIMDEDDPLYDRMIEKAAPWESFVNPFGTASSARLRVDTAAEASLLYERGIRGELASAEVVRSLIDRGNVPQMSDDAFNATVHGLDEQFRWIRTQIRTGENIADRQVVTQDLLVSDASMGRSVYHPVYAPSPAHILAHYIKNPLLLDDSSSECITARALEQKSQNEPAFIAPLVGAKQAVIVIDGSDTIGGRVPNSRGVKKHDARTKKDYYEFQIKSREEVQADYDAFQSRLDEVLSRIPEDMNIILLVDGDRKRGMNDMVCRYVEERKGAVCHFDYVQGEIRRDDSDKGRKVTDHISMVAMPHFDWVQPVLAGGVSSVEIPLDGMDDTLSFQASQLSVDGYVLFSDLSDNRSSQVLRRGAVAVASGLPLVHVMNLESQSRQAEILSAGVEDSRLSFVGGQEYAESLFAGTPRTRWEVNLDSPFYRADGEASYAYQHQDGAVYVGGVPFTTIAGTYAAMLAREALDVDSNTLRKLAEGETSREQLLLAAASVGYDKKATPALREKCLRNAVHQMASVSSPLRQALLGSGDGEIVVNAPAAQYSGGNTILSGLEDSKSIFAWLAVDGSGKGENALGVVFAAERDNIRQSLDIVRKRALEESRRVADEQSRALRRAKSRHALGQKMQAGFPSDVADIADAVWFGGTARPLGLTDESRESFTFWDNEQGEDPLVREIVGRALLSAGDDKTVPNKFIYIGASNALVASGKRFVKNFPNGRDLTGVTRTDPESGRSYVCGFAVPVKKDMEFNEPNNPEGMPSSFYSDADSELVRSSFIDVFAQARHEAIEHGCAICTERICYTDRYMNTTMTPVLGKVFQDETLVPKLVEKTVRNEKTGRKETKMVRKWERAESKHRSRHLALIAERSLKMLEVAKELPLNFICLPRADYQEERFENGFRAVPDEVFLSDLEFAVRSADALAVRRGLPLRFALDENGRIDLGPGLTEHQRDIAEQFIDSYIGVRKDASLEKEIDIHRISDHGLYMLRKEKPFEEKVSSFTASPNALMAAFGRYDFSNLLASRPDVLHKMNFVDGEGDVFQIYEPRLSTRCSTEVINNTLAYESNTERRFLVRSSNPDKISSFIAQVEDIIARLQEVKIEFRLSSPDELSKRYPEGVPMDGYFELLPSNSRGDEETDEKFVVRTRETLPSDLHSSLDYHDDKEAYAGYVQASDSFRGYVEYRAVVNGVPDSHWKIVSDKETWKEAVMSVVMRDYRSDTCRVASKATVEDFLRSDYVSRLGLSFVRSSVLNQVQTQAVSPDSKIVSGEYVKPGKGLQEKGVEPQKPSAEQKTRKGFTMNVNQFKK